MPCTTASARQPLLNSADAMTDAPSDSRSDLTFYEDTRTAGAVIAVRTVRDDGRVEGWRSTFEREDSPVSWGAVNPPH
jgi:hypothetical protein